MISLSLSLKRHVLGHCGDEEKGEGDSQFEIQAAEEVIAVALARVAELNISTGIYPKRNTCLRK